MDAHYDLEEFVGACKKDPKTVFVHKGAVATADSDFNLKGGPKVVEFIGNDGLEEPKLARLPKPWENNPTPHIPIMVDSYDFFSGTLYGYVAFFFSPVTKMWNIKSFKKNTKPDPRAFAIQHAFAKAGFILGKKVKQEKT